MSSYSFKDREYRLRQEGCRYPRVAGQEDRQAIWLSAAQEIKRVVVMAYTRWSTQPDPLLYIYESTKGGLICLDCPLSELLGLSEDDDYSFRTDDGNVMVDHVRMHMEANGFVPREGLLEDIASRNQYHP